MKNYVLAAALPAVMLFASPVSAQSVNYNTAPTQAPFTYNPGSGNDYSPANATVLTDGNNELAVRFHVTGQQAQMSNNGVYTFAINTSNISFDYSLFGNTAGANILLTNLLTGQTAFFDPFAVGDANGTDPGLQNSEQLGFGFLNNSGPFAGCCGNLGFNPAQNNTYRLDLTAGGNTVTSYAVVGTGAPVPEPATWAMMLVGFGGMGLSMRRSNKRKYDALTEIA